MPKSPRWKGQVEILHFDLAQVTAIASSARSEIFWAFQDDVPKSANEIAKEVGKSAQTVRYHINELVKVGLIMPVEHRKSRSRTEEAYVHVGLGNYSQPGVVSDEYREMMNKGFEAMTRIMAKEREAMLELKNLEPDKSAYHAHVRWTVRLSREQALQVKKILIDAITEAAELNDEDGVRAQLAIYMSTTLGESRRLLAARKKGRGTKG